MKRILLSKSANVYNYEQNWQIIFFQRAYVYRIGIIKFYKDRHSYQIT